MKRTIPIIFSLIILVFISGCGPGQAVAPTVTPSSPPTDIPTSTPTLTPTDTPTIIPTITPLPITNTPSPPGTVTGIVVNSSAVPLTNVGVKLLRNGKLVTETKVNPEGNFTFENIPPGKYMIGYDYFPEGGFAVHYFGEEFVVESESTTQQEFVIENR